MPSPLDGLTEAQERTIAAGLLSMPNLAPPRAFGFASKQRYWWVDWDLPGYVVRLEVAPDGTPRADVTTRGRIEEYPLVAGLMLFLAQLQTAFDGTTVVYTGDVVDTDDG